VLVVVVMTTAAAGPPTAPSAPPALPTTARADTIWPTDGSAEADAGAEGVPDVI